VILKIVLKAGSNEKRNSNSVAAFGTVFRIVNFFKEAGRKFLNIVIQKIFIWWLGPLKFNIAMKKSFGAKFRRGKSSCLTKL
jgi:hypothetical protein